MKINRKIIDKFIEANINASDGLCYLFALYHELSPTYIPDILKTKVNMLGIVEKNVQGGLKWNIPLYEKTTSEKGNDSFDWVKTEYVPLFKEANSSKGGHARESMSRMKKLFAKNPDIRKHEVLEATKIYIQNTDPNYIRFPHYFIEKGQGDAKTQDILTWIDRYREEASQNDAGRVSPSNTMRG